MTIYAKPPPLPRLAHRIREQLLKYQTHDTDHLQYQLANLSDPLGDLLTIRKRLSLCQEHGFHFARTKVIEELRYLLSRLVGDIGQVEHRIPVVRHVIPLGELVQELQQVEDEFGAWRFERDDSTLIVTTEPIELEHLMLGPFEIRLNLESLGRNTGSPPYTVVALEPNCPTSKDNVTHPHVSDEHLCEGEATAAIHGALKEGRICDFFILVRSVLQTYNRDSPYVALENWSGTPCHDCGYLADDDDRSYCESCDHDYCSECISSCSDCDRTICSGCLEECQACNEYVCSRCMGTCSTCGKPCCNSCLDEDLCPDCHDQQEKEITDDESNESTQPQSVGGAQCAILIQNGRRARRRARHQAA